MWYKPKSKQEEIEIKKYLKKMRGNVTSSTRQGFYMLFIILLMFIGPYFLAMSFFQVFLIIGVTGIILKLADIEEAIK